VSPTKREENRNTMNLPYDLPYFEVLMVKVAECRPKLLLTRLNVNDGKKLSSGAFNEQMLHQKQVARV
jgi:hypothetical protein